MKRPRDFFIILILGALTTVSPFSIDMYLPAFPDIAAALHTTPAKISLSVSGYFIGLAFGQLFYGPMLDRFGRKRPLYAGLSLFIVGSIGCLLAKNAEMFITFRILQALGGCVAQVGAMTMVRDFFPVKDCAKIISLLLLVLGVSPLFAPTVGGYIVTSIGWQWIFVVLAAHALIMMLVVAFLLPEGHQPDPTISLKPARIAGEFIGIIKSRQFHTFALAGAFSFSGLFVYVSGTPIIYMEYFHVSKHAFGLIFALGACSFIGGSQLNHVFLRKHGNHEVFRTAVICQNIVAPILLTGTLFHWYGLLPTVALLLMYLPCCGIASPNAVAIALSPYTKNIGSAAALQGFIQMGIGAFCSTGAGLLNAKTPLPIFVVMNTTALIGLGILLVGTRRLKINSNGG